VSLLGNTYQVDDLLTGRRVELVFDPFDLTDIAVRYDGRSFGPAVPFRIGRHSHPKARPEHPDPAPAPTGIDYLHLVAATHNGQLADRINYDALISQPTQPAQATDADLPADGQIPGQLDLTDLFGDGEREADR
jgi:putative transposase